MVISRRNIRDWWAQLIKPQDQSKGKERAILITYTVWNLWEERCKRVFDNKAHSQQELLETIKNDLQLLQLAQEEL